MKIKFREIEQNTPLPNGGTMFKCEHRNLMMLRTYKNNLIHIAVAHPKRLLSWDEIHWIRDNVMGDCRYVAVVIPPKNVMEKTKGTFYIHELNDKDLGIEILPETDAKTDQSTNL